MRFYEKLYSGWFWIGQIFEEWHWTMIHSEGNEFFEYLHYDYVAYEEDMYYQVKDGNKIH